MDIDKEYVGSRLGELSAELGEILAWLEPQVAGGEMISGYALLEIAQTALKQGTEAVRAAMLL